jgi:probable biosynthetic protein (TIGR04098 family)
VTAPALWPSGPSLTDLAPADGLPAAPRRIRIGMPQLDIGGLSEGWLYRTCGDLHWEAIGRELGVSSDGFRAGTGERLYPTVVALRARYGAPLAAVNENDVLAAKVLVRPCGRACAHGRIDLSVAGRRSSVELLTTFAVHQPGGGLRMAIPAPELAERWLVEAPRANDPSREMIRLAKAARGGQALDDDFCGPSLRTREAPLGRFEYEPSPYADYNGAGLLYFAAYVSIADTAERALVRRLGLSPRPRTDWALATSTVRRSVFFYANLPLGEPLVIDLLRFELSGARGVKTHLRLSRPSDGRVMADLITERRFVREGR